MSGCLHEPALWPAANGEPIEPEIADHLRRCAHCSDQVALLRDHRRELRGVDVDAASAFAASEPAPVTGHPPRQFAWKHPGPGPARIGPYVVERLLRVGGQAEVYLAAHPDQPERVVVKWAFVSIAEDPSMADQFTEEARLLSAVRHPNLPGVRDLGIADGRPYLVLEYIAGETLAAHRERRWPPIEAAGLVARLARALERVHEYGRLHLDIQPDNILLGHDGEPRLIDFGMSRSRSEVARCGAGLTGYGTPEYMAPEQLTGNGERIGVATDIYALGAVLHELLTGTRPLPEVVWEQEARGRRSAGRSSTATRLARICRRALHPDPQRRYQSAGKFARALDRVASGERGILLTATGLIVIAGMALGWWTTPTFVRTHDWDALPAASPAVQRALIADAVHRLLDDPAAYDWSVSIILADGRVVPVAARPGRASSTTPEFAHTIATQLESLQGTTLLLMSARPVPMQGPPLPPGTVAHLSDNGVTMLAPVAVAGRSAAGVPHALNGLQHRLRIRNSQFRALVVALPTEVRTDGS